MRIKSYASLARGAAVFILLAAVVFTAALLGLSGSDLIRDRVTEHLRELTALPCTVGYVRLSPSLKSVFSVSIEDLHIETADKKSFFVRRVVVYPALTSLLHGEPSVKEVLVRGFRISAYEESDGSIRIGSIPLPSLNDATDGKAILAKGLAKIRVARVVLEEGALDIVLKTGHTDREVVVPIRDIHGSITKSASTQAFSGAISVRPGAEQGDEPHVRIETEVQLAEDGAQPKSVSVRMSADTRHFKHLQALLSSPVQTVSPTNPADVTAELAWTNREPLVVAFKGSLRPQAGTAGNARIQGRVTANPGDIGLRSVEIQGSADSLALHEVTRFIPRSLPFQRDTGSINGTFQATWSSSRGWNGKGSFSIENAVPSEPFGILDRGLSARIEFNLDGSHLVLESMEVHAGERLAVLRGKMHNLFSSDRSLDLGGAATFKGSWTEFLAVPLPEGLKVQGDFPLQIRIQGGPDNLLVDLNGDLSSAVISWGPYLERRAGGNGRIWLKGTVSEQPAAGKTVPTLEARAGVEMEGIVIGSDSPRPTPSPCSVRAQSRLWLNRDAIEVRDVEIVVREHEKDETILSASASATSKLADDPTFDGQVTVNTGHQALKLMTAILPERLKIEGSSKITSRLSGRLSALNCFVEVPLDRLDIRLGQLVHKPTGVSGVFRGTAKWSGDGLDLKTASLSLPGLSTAIRGKILEPDGSPGRVQLNVEKGALQRVTRYLPNIGPIARGLSGGFRAMLHVDASNKGKGFLPQGTIDLNNVSYQPERAPWSLAGIEGTLDLLGDSVKIRKLVGHVAGGAQGRFTVQGTLTGLTTPRKALGHIAVQAKDGWLKADRMAQVMAEGHSLIGSLIQPRPIAMDGDLLKFNTISGKFKLREGKVGTVNLRLIGPGFLSAGIGTVDLMSLNLEMLFGTRAKIVGSRPLEKIPGLRSFVEKHKKRLNLVVEAYIRIHGPLTSTPELSPVKKSSLDEMTVDRFRHLLRTCKP